MEEIKTLLDNAITTSRAANSRAIFRGRADAVAAFLDAVRYCRKIGIKACRPPPTASNRETSGIREAPPRLASATPICNLASATGQLAAPSATCSTKLRAIENLYSAGVDMVGNPC